MLEPLGIRFFGVEFRESHLMSILNALRETLGRSPNLKTGVRGIEEFVDATLEFGDLIIETGAVLDTNPETLRKLFSESGLITYESFFVTLLRNMAKRKSLVSMLSSLSSIVVESGSSSVRFRNKANRIETLPINLKKIWKEIKKRSKQIKNSFRHLLEVAVEEIKQAVYCIGVYGAAFVLAILSLWYGVAFSVTSGLSTVAQNILNSLKICFPILSFIIWIFCLLYGIAGGVPKARDAYEAMKQFLG